MLALFYTLVAAIVYVDNGLSNFELLVVTGVGYLMIYFEMLLKTIGGKKR